MDKPEFKEGLFECSCGSKDTVALDLSHHNQPYDTVIWCSCGNITILDGDKPPEVVHKF